MPLVRRLMSRTRMSPASVRLASTEQTNGTAMADPDDDRRNMRRRPGSCMNSIPVPSEVQQPISGWADVAALAQGRARAADRGAAGDCRPRPAPRWPARSPPVSTPRSAMSSGKHGQPLLAVSRRAGSAAVDGFGRSHAAARIALPIVIEKAQPLIFRAYRPGDRLEKGVWNIPIPAEGEPVLPDIVISPMVGVDPRNYRLGYGGGFFDRTLAAMPRKPLVIGVGYEHAAHRRPSIRSRTTSRWTGS